RRGGGARRAEAVTASFAGGEPTIAFNPHYLLDGLTAAAAGAEEAPAPDAPAASIRLEFTSPAKPALVTLADGGEEPGGAGEPGGEGPAAGPPVRHPGGPPGAPTRARCHGPPRGGWERPEPGPPGPAGAPA